MKLAKYGQLTPIREVPERSKKKCVQWLFLCDCGNEVIAEAYKVRSGHRTTCGHGLRNNPRRRGDGIRQKWVARD